MPETPEQRARQQIDAQLASCGWIVQDFKAVDLSAGRGIALREAPLTTGPCDYLLLVDRKAPGVIEAKKVGTTLSTGTDIKPLEVLIFLRDVRSRVYFEQMKGRGTRVVTPIDLQSVSGEDARAKTRFVIVDVRGKEGDRRCPSRPLETKLLQPPCGKSLSQFSLATRPRESTSQS